MIRAFTHTVAAFCLVLSTAAAVAGQTLPTAKPESVGMSSERLARLTAVMESYTREKQIAGTVTLVMRGGRLVYLEAAGKRDLEKDIPMSADTIFRIASMSKAITTVGAMMLVEEGKMLLTDAVSKYIPAFERTPAPDLIPDPRTPSKPITIRQLMTHTSGVSYGGGDLEDIYTGAGFTQWYFADREQPIGYWIEKLATLPFEADPGSRYVYGYSTDILGYVIEKVSGMPLDQYLANRILAPLKMVDTTFFLPPAKEPRLATVYGKTASTKVERAPEGHPGQGAYVRGPRAAFSGGAGLLSTASDYARFLQMLLNGGELDGVRILSPKTIELMTRNHIADLYPTPGRGFGLGFETVEDLGRSGRYGSEGEFSWGSAYFSRYWIDPKEQLVAIFLAQLVPAGGLDLQEKVRVLVNQAIVGPVNNAKSPSRSQTGGSTVTPIPSTGTKARPVP